jgi:hypothetical protein
VKEKTWKIFIQQSLSRTLSVVRGDWKYIAPSNSPVFEPNTLIELGQDTIPQLYRLTDDAGERKNVAGENPGKVKELVSLLESVK